MLATRCSVSIVPVDPGNINVTTADDLSLDRHQLEST